MIKKRNDLYGEYLVKKFNEHFFESYYCSTKEEATKILNKKRGYSIKL